MSMVPIARFGSVGRELAGPPSAHAFCDANSHGLMLGQVSKCIKALNKHGGATGEQLRACLRYSTMHYNSDTTPRYIRNALAS